MPIRILPLSSRFLSSDKGGRGREGQGQRPIYEPSSVRAGAGGYRAPEVVGTRRPTLKADFYSLGVLLLELLTGKSPTPTSRLTPIFPPHASSRLYRGRCAPPPDLRPSNPPGNTTRPGSALSESRRLRQRWHTPPPGSNPVTGSSSSPSPAGESSRCSFD